VTVQLSFVLSEHYSILALRTGLLIPLWFIIVAWHCLALYKELSCFHHV
jgi:hypothetical protein